MDIIPDLGKDSLFIWAAYAFSLGTLLMLTIYTLRQNRKRKK